MIGQTEQKQCWQVLKCSMEALISLFIFFSWILFNSIEWVPVTKLFSFSNSQSFVLSRAPFSPPFLITSQPVQPDGCTFPDPESSCLKGDLASQYHQVFARRASCDHWGSYCNSVKSLPGGSCCCELVLYKFNSIKLSWYWWQIPSGHPVHITHHSIWNYIWLDFMSSLFVAPLRSSFSEIFYIAQVYEMPINKIYCNANVKNLTFKISMLI